MKLLRWGLAAPVVAYAAACVFVYFYQERLLFFPSPVTAAELATRAKKGRFVEWRDSHNRPIGWKSTEGDPAHALLVCHGNGGFALETRYKDMSRSKFFQLCQLEYPGYGQRPGTPSAKALLFAALDAIDTLHAEDPSRRIWLVGESMGTGTVCAVAAARPGLVAGIVLLVPFDTLGHAAWTHVPWLPVSLLLRNEFNSVKNLGAYRGPVAFVLAEKDEVVPPRLGHRLYDSFAGPKRLWLIPGIGHGDRDDMLRHWPEYESWLLERSSNLPNKIPAPAPAPH